MLQPLQSELLNKVGGIRHGFFTRHGGISTAPFDSLNCVNRADENPIAVIENRRRIAKWFDADVSQLSIPHQVHGHKIMTVDENFDFNQAQPCDALMTAQYQRIVGVVTADCVPVLFYDPIQRSVAAVHAGWRSALQGIIYATLKAFTERGSLTKNILVAVGPSIQQSSYQVSHEVLSAFIDVDQKYQDFFVPDPAIDSSGKFSFDLPGLVVSQLGRANIHQIDWLKIDTYTNPQLFFSCRRNAHQGQQFYGAMLTGIMLQG